MSDTVSLSLDEARALSLAILEGHGYAPDHAHAIMHSIIAAQRDECHSHGLYRLIDCVKVLKNGAVDPVAKPDVIDQAPAVVRVDAHNGNSLWGFEAGRPQLIEKARKQGIAAMAINHAFHFSALWPEVESLAEEGLAAMAMGPTIPYVAPHGGNAPLLGTNPFAFSWPRGNGEPPFTFDFATSMAARGEVELHHRAGRDIPAGWAIDAQGAPTTDAAAAMQGSLLPFGAHKGSALSLMIELLAGPMIGDLLSQQIQASGKGAQGGPQHGELILAMDPTVFGGGDAAANLARAEMLFDGVRKQGARVPSTRRHEARKRSDAAGVQIPQELHAELIQLRDEVTHN